MSESLEPSGKFSTIAKRTFKVKMHRKPSADGYKGTTQANATATV